MTAITEFLFPAPARRNTLAIWGWWEERRIGYNLIVGGFGLFSLGVTRLITWLPPNAHSEFFPLPLILVFGVMANICYCLGPTAEVLAEKVAGRKLLPLGPTLFRMGLTFSVGLTLLPTLISVFDLGIRILKAVL